MRCCFVEFVEFMFGVSMFFNAILFIPQAVKIYKTKNARDLSLTTFIGFNMIQLFTILHGYVRNDWPLVRGMGMSFVFCGAVTFLIFLYRNVNRFR